jgi:hypothetical protein
MDKRKNKSLQTTFKDIENERISYFDSIQTGPMEEEILQEFYFDPDRFKEYLKERELDQLQDKKYK